MKKYILLSVCILVSCIGFSQEGIQGTVKSESGYIIAVYMTPTALVVANNSGNNNTITFNIAVSFVKGSFSSAPVPVVTSFLPTGINASQAPGSPTLEFGRYVYTYIISGATAAFTWNIGVELPVIKLDFPNSPFFTGNFPRLQNDPTGGPTFQSFFYTEVNGADVTNYNDTFYGGPEGSSPVPFVEATTPLPITLIAFNAAKYGERSSILSWSTANESNSSHFIVQRSTDRRTWSNAGKVSAAGNSQAILNYEFFDQNVYNGLDSKLTVYYRLQMVDLDGQTKISPIESVAFGKGADATTNFLVYPNPASDGLQVEWDASSPEQPTSLEFYDVTGKLVFTQKVADKTNQEYVDFKNGNIQSGLYMLRIMNGTEPLDHKQIVVGQNR